MRLGFQLLTPPLNLVRDHLVPERGLAYEFGQRRKALAENPDLTGERGDREVLVARYYVTDPHRFASPSVTPVNRSSASISSIKAVSMDSSEGPASVIGEPLCVAMTASLVAVVLAARRGCMVGQRLGSAGARGIRWSACGYYRLRRTTPEIDFLQVIDFMMEIEGLEPSTPAL